MSELIFAPTQIYNTTRCSITSSRSVSVNESPFTFNQQVYKFPGHRWEVSFDLAPMTQADHNEIQYFLIALQGMYNYTALDLEKLEGGERQMAWTDGVGPSSYSIAYYDTSIPESFAVNQNVASTPENVTDYFKKGDWITVRRGSGGSTIYEAFKIAADENTDSWGTFGGVEVDPKPEDTTVYNSSTLLRGGRCLLRLTSNDVSWVKDANGLYSTSLTFVEAK